MASQLSGGRPSAFDRLNAIPELTALRSATTHATADAATPNFSANDWVLTSNGSIYVPRKHSPGCGGLCIAINESPRSSIHTHWVSEFEGQTPIAADPYRQPVLRLPFDWMKPITRHIHINNDSRRIQRRQLQSKSSCMFGLNTRLAPHLEKRIRPMCLNEWSTALRSLAYFQSTPLVAKGSCCIFRKIECSKHCCSDSTRRKYRAKKKIGQQELPDL